MARTASFTTTGQPITAPPMTLDAMMQRQREVAKATPSPNREMISPWQGAAYLGEVLSQNVQQNRIDQELNDARQQYAQLMSGVDYSGQSGGPTGEQIGNAMLYSEEGGAALAQLAATLQQRKLEREQQLADRDAEWKREDAQPQEALGKLKWALDRGQITQEQYDAAVAKELAPTASSGMELEIDPETGRVTGFRQGTGIGGNKGGETQNAKNQVNALEDYRAAAKSANDLLPTIANMETAGDSAGYTGPGGSLYGTIDDALEAGSEFLLGKDYSLPGDSGARSAIKSGGLTFILDAVSKTKGSISNAENALFASQAPGLQTTPEGRKTLLGIARGVAKRSILRDELAQKWFRQNGSLQGFEQSWSQYIEQNPLIAANPKTGTITLLGGGEETPAAGGTGGNLPTPQTQAEFDALPPGTRFIDPDDGKEYVK